MKTKTPTITALRMTAKEASRYGVKVGSILESEKGELVTIKSHLPPTDADIIEFVVEPWNPLTDGQRRVVSRRS